MVASWERNRHSMIDLDTRPHFEEPHNKVVASGKEALSSNCCHSGKIVEVAVTAVGCMPLSGDHHLSGDDSWR